MKTIVIGGSHSKKLAKQVAKNIRAPYSDLLIRNFPDGELYMRLLKEVKGRRVVYINTMHPNPNDSLLEAIFALQTAKELGAKKTVLVAPYLCYMRQDKRFKSGECKSNTIMSSLLDRADKIVTIDPHLHRISSLNDIFSTKTTGLTANSTLARWIAKKYKRAQIMGPDGESYQWAQAIAEELGEDAIILKKKRYSSRTVRTSVGVDVDVRGQTIILVDDIISSGHTMIEPIKQLKRKGAKKIICLCVHGIFAEDALTKLQRLGATVVSTNSITNPVSKIDISTLLAEAL
jgi:ribose-phosphate pyrophosphokinase